MLPMTDGGQIAQDACIVMQWARLAQASQGETRNGAQHDAGA